MIGIRYLIALFICALTFGTLDTMAFTVIRSTGSVNSKPVTAYTPKYIEKPTPTTTARPAFVVDQAIAEMVSRSDPLGALIMGILVASLFEVFTPGRAKKE